jgi:osmotically-inducible protein OsmY
LLKVHLRPDADIRHDVEQEVLHQILAVEDGVDVMVADGVVRLLGNLDRRSSTRVACRLAAQVSGVVNVVDELTYDFDDTNPVLMMPGGQGNPIGIL